MQGLKIYFTKVHTLLAVICAMFYVLPTSAQDMREVGAPLMHFYSASDYNAHAQNWAATQDSSGRIFFANNHGVLRFDSQRWQLAPTLNGGLIRSMAKDKNGNIFWGGQNDFGIIGSDSTGSMALISLAHLIPDTLESYNNVPNILINDNGVYFRSNKYIFWYRDNRITVISNDRWFQHGFVVNGRAIVQQFPHGLFFLDGDELTKIPGSEIFSRDNVGAILPMDNGDWMVVTYFKGIYKFDGSSFTVLESDIDEILKSAMGYKALKLKSGNVAIATIHNGLFLINQDGKLLNSIHVEQLPTTELYEDDHDGLWAVLDGGLARLELEAPFSVFGKEEGVTNGGWITTRFNGKLYLGSSSGLYVLEQNDLGPALFKKVDDFNNQIWALLPTERGLLIGSQQGLFVYDNNSFQTILANLVVRTLKPSIIQPDLILVGSMLQFRTLKYENRKWQLSSAVSGIETNTHYIAETLDSTIWLGSHFQGITSIQHFFDERENVISRYEDGFPERNDTYTNAFVINDHVSFGTSSGLYRLDQSNRIVPDSSFGELFAGPGLDVFRVRKTSNKDWFVRSQENGLLEFDPDSGYTWNTQPFRRLPAGPTQDFFLDRDSVVWMSTRAAIVRYDRTFKKSYDLKSSVRFHSISLINNDSLLYGGQLLSNSQNVQLTSDLDGIRFQYALPQFDDPSKTEFSYRLVGIDEAWSSWTLETQKDYTNLPHREYAFEIRARDIYGNVSEASVFEFVILPPWYQTGIAYFMYVILGFGSLGGFVLIAVRWNSRRLEERNRELESQVSLRTQEIQNQKEIIELQAEAQTRFFTNVSHELRTPLTLTIGPLEDLKNDEKENLSEGTNSKVKLALRNSKRLLSLVSQILDVSRLEASENVTEVSKGDLGTFVKAIAQNFNSLANRRNIHFEIEAPDEMIAYFNQDHVEKIATNLLSNAFKFTGSENNISISLEALDDLAVITVQDTGMGIPEDELPSIFDRFYQSKNSKSRLQHGTGIGLALVKHLVELYGGNIVAESEVGKGTSFKIELPISASSFENITIAEENSFPQPLTSLIVDGEEILEMQNSSPLEDSDHTTVLVVEDNHELRQFISDHLRKDYRVVEAVHGKEGLIKAREELPDIVVSDVMMPEMDGFEFVKKLRSDTDINFLPVILLTGRDTKEDTIEGLEKGANDYIVKPFDMNELKARIKSTLRSQKLLKAKLEADTPLLSLHKEDLKSADQEFLELIQTSIQEYITDSSLSVEKLAELANMDRSTLHRKITTLTGEKPVQLIRRLRLEQAEHMIRGKAGSISEIAYSVGFESISWFTKCFKEKYKLTPSEMLQKAK